MALPCLVQVTARSPLEFAKCIIQCSPCHSANMVLDDEQAVRLTLPSLQIRNLL